MAQNISIFSPRNDPTCLQCLRTTVPPSFSREYFQECKAKGYPESEQWCLPYSIVTDLTEEAPTLPVTSLRDNTREALILESMDSPCLPQAHMRKLLHRSQGWKDPPPPPFSQHSKANPRPLVLFPPDMDGKQRACLMGTFDKGKIDEAMTQNFMCGVWPTITHRDDSMASHIHTTPRWTTSPAFILAIQYPPTDKKGPWQGLDFRLSAEATRALRKLCKGMADKWIGSRGQNMVGVVFVPFEPRWC
jgi:hypothetical protein